jgi:hypothetical protein
MTHGEQSNPTEIEPQLQPEIVTFNDTLTGSGSSGLLFEGTDGSALEWNSHKGLDNPASRSANTTIILTESGNQYIVGKGLIIDGRSGVAHIIPEGGHNVVPNLTFGKPWEAPGVFRTSANTKRAPWLVARLIKLLHLLPPIKYLNKKLLPPKNKVNIS